MRDLNRVRTTEPATPTRLPRHPPRQSATRTDPQSLARPPLPAVGPTPLQPPLTPDDRDTHLDPTASRAAAEPATDQPSDVHANAASRSEAPSTGDAAPVADTGPARADGRSPTGYIPGHGPKAHLTITIDYNALKTATTDATGDLVFGDNLSAAAVRRIACDAQVIPIVLGSKSQPLDVGTTKRLVTAPIRLALNARDRGCVVCGAPPIQCEAHHLVHWIDGGDTSVSNLVLLCKRHHLDLHAGHGHRNHQRHRPRHPPCLGDPRPSPTGRYKPPTTTTPQPPAPQAPTPRAPAIRPARSTNHPHTNDPLHRARTQTNPPDLPINATPAEIRQAIWGDDDARIAPEPPQAASPPFDPWSDEVDAMPRPIETIAVPPRSH